MMKLQSWLYGKTGEFALSSLRSLRRLVPTEHLSLVVQRFRHFPDFSYKRFSKISTQLYLGIGSAVSFTFFASVVGWVSFDRVATLQRHVNENSVPKMIAAFAAAQESGALVAAAPRMVAAGSPEELALVASTMAGDLKDFENKLTALMQDSRHGNRSAKIQEKGQALISNITAIQDSVSARFTISNELEVQRAELASLRDQIVTILSSTIDDQFFYVMTGYLHLAEPASPREQHFSTDQLSLYRHLAELQVDATIAVQVLSAAFNVAYGPQLEPLRERFEATARGINRRLAMLDAESRQPALMASFTQLMELGLGPEAGFNLRARELALDARQRELLAMNHNLAVELVAAVEGLVDAAGNRVQEATRNANQAIGLGRAVLFGVSAASLIAAVLISWLFVGRILLRRLERLSNVMRSMAAGDLEAEVDVRGRDEVADMARALEIFRRHALEVQRLNLVEKLAEELKQKNTLLESTMANLKQAQDQIVIREKLAALGELTAGVAHEIKNPLNFIKNFSEVSGELLDELLEEIPKVANNSQQHADSQDHPDINNESTEIINEIGSDLKDNLKRICEHGQRANTIVQNMLMMGRGSGEAQPTDINALLSQHARLAYHNARVSDPEFRLSVHEDFDQRIGMCKVVPQDLGRVFLNMAGNACYATDQKRRSMAKGNQANAGSSYQPSLTLSTRHLGNHIEIHIRDNGDGIPANVVDKIFNPFFTTKPADAGTGLGLALSNDIVRKHGGTIRVETEPGSFTEMIIRLPLSTAKQDQESLDNGV